MATAQDWQTKIANSLPADKQGLLATAMQTNSTGGQPTTAPVAPQQTAPSWAKPPSGTTSPMPGGSMTKSTATQTTGNPSYNYTETTTGELVGDRAAQASASLAKATMIADPEAINTELWNVDDNQLTSATLNKLISQDNPYMQLARTGASQTAASRGLLNSSMAAGAGEAAAIGAALPIAQSDANVYASAASQNTSAKNSTNQFNANLKYDASKTNAGFANDASNLNAQLQTDVSKANAGFANDQILQSSRISAEMAMQDKQLSSAEKIAAGNNSTSLSVAAMNNATSRDIAASNNATSRDIAAGNNAAAMARQAAELASLETRSDKALAADMAKLKANNDAAMERQAAELASIEKRSIEAITADMAKINANNAAAFERLQAELDGNLKTNYITTVGNYNVGYTNYVNQVNAMDIPVDAKTSLIQAATATYDDNIALVIAMLSTSPTSR